MRLPGYDNWLSRDFEHEHDRNQRLEALAVAARSGRYQALDRCIERAIRQTAEQAAKEVEQARI